MWSGSGLTEEEDQDHDRDEDRGFQNGGQEDQEVDGPDFTIGPFYYPSPPPCSLAESCESRVGGTREGEVSSARNPKTMSIVPTETIEVVAQTMGMANLSADVAQVLAPDVEYRLREIIQEAIKCMRHSKRTVLMAEDVDNALKLRNLEPLYGFSTGDPPAFKAAAGHEGLFYIDDRVVDFKDVIESPLPKALPDTSVVAHWLAIEGVQLAIPENPPLEALVDPSEHKKFEHGKEDGAPVDIKSSLKHDLSRDLQLYFQKITEITVCKYKSCLFKEVLKILATDSAIQPLLPYFAYFISNEVVRNLNDVPLLFALMRAARSLLQNPQLHIELYLHQLMPSIITCITAKRLGNKVVDNHWELRDFSTNLMASIYGRYGHVYNIRDRLLKTLIRTFLDPSKTLTQHYGAIQGLAALGPNETRLLILPNLETYLLLLDLEILPEKQKNEIKRSEAWRVYGALLLAAGKCLYDLLKLYPGLLSPPNLSALKHSVKIATMPNNNSNSLPAQQSPLKKLTVSVPVSSVPVMPMTSNTYSAPVVFGTSAPGEPGIRPCASSGRLSTENFAAGRRRRDTGSSRIANPQSILSQAWREDIDAGHLSAALFELFGEGILSFMQPPEMNIFL
ncbi:hypothetical protein AXF42_Ash015317 [Apostasia shenzhenica]|uniref:TATA box binding protein associated factor (TAF) histone-like fold domain-containing protein n=1 Tax=Apostasia shenzhenica TaxID=1088818 RepID=A0A2I0ALX4_9ASPA|nr:hypothetical protein AXF42_Ash015317 [Apostasia shenzhenica]